MVNIGLIGSVDTPKTTILRFFVKYLNTKKINSIEGGTGCKLEKTDISGEAVLDPETGVKENKTIHPNRVLFKTNEKINHTLFAPPIRFHQANGLKSRTDSSCSKKSPIAI